MFYGNKDGDVFLVVTVIIIMQFNSKSIFVQQQIQGYVRPLWYDRKGEEVHGHYLFIGIIIMVTKVVIKILF